MKSSRGPVKTVNPARPRNRGRGFVQLSALCPETVARIILQSSAFVAANVEQPPAAAAGVKRDIPIETDPQTIKNGREEPIPERGVERRSHSGEIVITLVKVLQFGWCRDGEKLLQATLPTAADLVAACDSEAGVEEPVDGRRRQTRAYHASGLRGGTNSQPSGRRLRQCRGLPSVLLSRVLDGMRTSVRDAGQRYSFESIQEKAPNFMCAPMSEPDRRLVPAILLAACEASLPIVSNLDNGKRINQVLLVVLRVVPPYAVGVRFEGPSCRGVRRTGQPDLSSRKAR